MTIALGIDTGGTYTDAVLVDHTTGGILCAAKALTTRRDLAIGVGQAIDAVFQQQGAPAPSAVNLVSLSTTLATNAIVEGQGSPVCLILIGYDPELIQQYGFEKAAMTSMATRLPRWTRLLCARQSWPEETVWRPLPYRRTLACVILPTSCALRS
jgi:N-methylhydantoinase A/oxoprolinase/acetone carboxylase beta subunit